MIEKEEVKGILYFLPMNLKVLFWDLIVISVKRIMQ